MSDGGTGAPDDAEPSRIERRVEDLLSSGQVFAAHDLAKSGLDRFPDATGLRLARALALARTGAAAEARALVDPLVRELDVDRAATVDRAVTALQRLAGEAGSVADPADAERLLRALADALEATRTPETVHDVDRADRLVRLADIYLSLWSLTGLQSDLLTVSILYRRCLALSPDLANAFGAALAGALLGDAAQAQDFARRVIAAHAALDTPGFADEARTGIAHLLLNDEDAARACFTAGQARLGRRSEETVPFLRMLDDLHRHGAITDTGSAACLLAPRIVVFTGHALDRPGAETSVLPASLELRLRAEIDARLDEMDVTIGYSLPRCGSDLLFIEALLERDAEVHVILPYDLEDFVAHCVRYAGRNWERRFRNALKLADTVTHATMERYLGHESLNRFANQYLHGIALLRAEFLRTDPFLLAVWDMREGSLPGGAADFIDQWENIERLRIIDLDALREEAGLPDLDDAPPVAGTGRPDDGPERQIRSMLFADIKGFSRLEDDAIPDFLAFHTALHAYLGEHGPSAPSVNTWGDAFFVVMEDATTMVDYALAMRDGVRSLRDRFGPGIAGLDLRVSLHAGPVFASRDAFRGQENYFGAHINRAARLEPVTIPGQIFATQQFVALLTVEQAARRTRKRMTGQSHAETVRCGYVGVMPLAKGFGEQAVYHVARR